jgi:predicted nucleic acid-binding protein
VANSKAPYIVGIDTQSLVWAVRRQGTASELDRAKWLFEELQIAKAQVLIPTIVVAEYLVPADKKTHASIIEAINRRFLIKPFDVECASLAAELFKVGKPMRQAGVPFGREVLRADTLIIATAKVHKAKVFYTDDKDCRELAATVLDARPLPVNSPHLFAPSKPDKSKRSSKPR